MYAHSNKPCIQLSMSNYLIVCLRLLYHSSSSSAVLGWSLVPSYLVALATCLVNVFPVFFMYPLMYICCTVCWLTVSLNCNLVLFKTNIALILLQRSALNTMPWSILVLRSVHWHIQTWADAAWRNLCHLVIVIIHVLLTQHN